MYQRGWGENGVKLELLNYLQIIYCTALVVYFFFFALSFTALSYLILVLEGKRPPGVQSLLLFCSVHFVRFLHELLLSIQSESRSKQTELICILNLHSAY